MAQTHLSDKKQAEEAHRQGTEALNKRVKELNCLFGIFSLVEKKDASLEDIFRGTLELIPPALQFPEITCARIVVKGKEYKTDKFSETDWKLARDIIVQGKKEGVLEVFYQENRPECHEGPFLVEETQLVEAIAGRLGKISERKQAQESLRKSEERFRILVENSLTGISIVQDDVIVYQNPEQERLLGPLPRSPKMHDIKNIHPDDIEKVEEFHRLISSGDVRTMETDFRFYTEGEGNKAPNMKWVHCRTSVIEYRGRDALLTNMVDITRTKELEHLLQFQDKMSSLGRVAAGIAHEIRNPLSGINIYLNALKKMFAKGENFDKVDGIIKQIQSASTKIEAVIKRVMDFSKPGRPNLVLLDINHPIEEAISLSSVTLRKSDIRITKTLEPNLPLCPLDPQLIEQVILNLINNAAESMRDHVGKRRIEVVSYFENTSIFVRISDSGPGVPENIANKIFDPFYSTKNGSTGIGLSLCHRTITDHGGTLTLSKSKWNGAQFVIEIPQ